MKEGLYIDEIMLEMTYISESFLMLYIKISTTTLFWNKFTYIVLEKYILFQFHWNTRTTKCAQNTFALLFWQYIEMWGKLSQLFLSDIERSII